MIVLFYFSHCGLWATCSFQVICEVLYAFWVTFEQMQVHCNSEWSWTVQSKELFLTAVCCLATSIAFSVLVGTASTHLRRYSQRPTQNFSCPGHLGKIPYQSSKLWTLVAIKYEQEICHFWSYSWCKIGILGWPVALCIKRAF